MYFTSNKAVFVLQVFVIQLSTVWSTETTNVAQDNKKKEIEYTGSVRTHRR